MLGDISFMTTNPQEESLPEKPARRDEIEAIPVHDDLVLYDGINKNGISLNQTARKVWDLLDGSRSVDMMAEEIAGELDITEADVIEEIKKDVRTTLLDFKRNQLLK